MLWGTWHWRERRKMHRGVWWQCPEKKRLGRHRLWLIDWLIYIWVLGLSAPIHLSLDEDGPFVSHIESWEPRNLTVVRDGPQTYTSNVLGLQKRSPCKRVWVRPKPRTHIECEPWFPLPPRSSYTRSCQAALVGKYLCNLATYWLQAA